MTPMGYQIKMVSDMLGIPKNTLIAWERRYAIVDPIRTEGGYRVYSDRDLSVLRRVQSLLDQGYKIGEACAIVLTAPASESASARELPDTDRAALTDVKEQLKSRLLVFDREGADAIGMRLLLIPFEQVIDEVYFPLLREVGQGWELGNVTVVQEHYATAYCREKLLVMLNSVQAALPGAPEVTCATPPGEHHELGLLALALRLSVRGFRVLYLGANLPTGELILHVNARKPAALCLSMIHLRSRGEVLAYARELRAGIDASVRIAIGGRATEDATLHIAGVSFAGHGLPDWLNSAELLRRAG